jgi:phage shock protein PspC (stress-responsive transcriptional regulator)
MANKEKVDISENVLIALTFILIFICVITGIIGYTIYAIQKPECVGQSKEK